LTRFRWRGWSTGRASLLRRHVDADQWWLGWRTRTLQLFQKDRFAETLITPKVGLSHTILPSLRPPTMRTAAAPLGLWKRMRGDVSRTGPSRVGPQTSGWQKRNRRDLLGACIQGRLLGRFLADRSAPFAGKALFRNSAKQ
jgi:hypothetical protein